MAIDIKRLQRASMHLSDVVAEPARWTEVLEEITTAVGAIGAGLIPQTGSEGAVATANLRDCLETYVRESWTEQDSVSHLRARALLMRGEIAIDRDLLVPMTRGRRFSRSSCRASTASGGRASGFAVAQISGP